MGRGTTVNLLYGAPVPRPRAAQVDDSVRIAWMKANRLTYIRTLGHTCHEMLRRELEGRLAKRYGPEAEVVLHDINVRSDVKGQETIGGYYEIYFTDADGARRCPAGTQDVIFEGDELLEDRWRGLIDGQIDRWIALDQ